MINEFLQDQAAVFVSGAMSAEEREEFGLILEFNEDLRQLVTELAEIGAALTLATQPPAGILPSPGLKSQIVSLISTHPQQRTTEGLVVTGPEGLVQWINPAFSTMCGYALEELRGKKLGPVLQGDGTDRETVARLRLAVHERRPCHEVILNYHKNGAPYWVEIAITPVFAGGTEPQWLIARERELSGRETPPR